MTTSGVNTLTTFLRNCDTRDVCIGIGLAAAFTGLVLTTLPQISLTGNDNVGEEDISPDGNEDFEPVVAIPLPVVVQPEPQGPQVKPFPPSSSEQSDDGANDEGNGDSSEDGTNNDFVVVVNEGEEVQATPASAAHVPVGQISTDRPSSPSSSSSAKTKTGSTVPSIVGPTLGFAGLAAVVAGVFYAPTPPTGPDESFLRQLLLQFFETYKSHSGYWTGSYNSIAVSLSKLIPTLSKDVLVSYAYMSSSFAEFWVKVAPHLSNNS